jgi:hypothetical protein
MAESVPPKKIIRRLHILKRKYTTAHSICTRQANGMYSPQDINKAYAMEIQKVPGVSTKIAQAIVDGAAKESFHTPWEAMRIRGVTQEIIDNLLEGGFYFGISGAAMLGPLEIAPDMSREAKIHVEFGFTGGPLVEQTCSIGRNVEPIEEEREFDGPKLSAGHKLAVRLIDSSGRTVGYRTAAGTALTIEDLEVDIRSGRRNLELVKIHGRSYLRRPANDTEADNLSKLQVERIDRL